MILSTHKAVWIININRKSYTFTKMPLSYRNLNDIQAQ